jgi:uncharacterized membrane protein YeaQ/YmgE (transglycosylase-associated protein family)
VNPQPARIPNFKRILITGALLGFVAGMIVSLVGDPVSGYSATTAALYLGVTGAVLGTAVAGLFGVLIDRSGRDDR